MEGESFDIVNWKIVNFSCWNQDLHGKYIESPEIDFSTSNFKMKFYPRGTSGQEEHMVVHLSIICEEEECSGDLSFIGANGSTHHTQRVQFKEGESDIELPLGPKFEDVIIQIGENESDQKDQLTLRFQIKSHYYDEIQICTIIQVFDVTLEVDCNIILNDHEQFSYIKYVHDDHDSGVDLGSQIREDKKIELYLYTTKKETFLVKTHLSLNSSDGSLKRNENNEHMFHEAKKWTFSNSLSEEELSENVRSIILHLKIISGIINNTLQNVFFRCDGVKIVPDLYKSDCKEKSPKNDSAVAYNDEANAVSVLLRELMCLFQDQDFSDLQLKCETVSFPVHRNILSARSTVFKTMLSSDMKEAASGCVEIEDLDAPTLSRFLAFLYTGAVEDLQGESALKLYYAADKYNVPSLKTECVNFLSANVCVSNVCDVLSLGDKHQDEELTAAAHNFILKNFNEVLKSREWNSFMCSDSLLAVKTVTQCTVKHFSVK